MADSIKNHMELLYQKIEERARSRQTFVDFCDDTLTYRQLLDSSQRLDAFFKERNLAPGSKVLIISRHDKHAITLFVSTLLAGLLPVMLSFDTKSNRVQAIAKKISPELIFVDEGLKADWPWLGDYTCIMISDPSNKSVFSALLRRKEKTGDQYPALLDNCDKSKPSCKVEEGSLAFLAFTSGTTSSPKGILTTHVGLFEHLKTIVRVFSYNDESRIFNNLALAHMDGLVQGPLLALYSGALLVRPKAFTIQNMESLLNVVFSKRVTHLILVPTILSLIDRLTTNNDYFEGEEFSNIISVADKLDRNLWDRLQKRFGVRICNVYGLSETVAGGLFSGPADDTFALGTVGKPIDMDARIVNERGEDCSENEEGELWLRGPNVTPGYYEDKLATESMLCGEWLRTGDVARLNSEGFYEIVGRKKAIIVSGGYNIHPAEIDEVLMQYPNVVDSVTVGMPDSDWGELVVSAVESNELINEADLIQHCRKYLESMKVPKSIAVIEKLPRGISEKVILSDVAELISAHMNPPEKNVDTINISEVIDLAASVFNVPVDSLTRNNTTDDIAGWDSLGHLNLITAVEKSFGLKFGIDEMMKVDSLQSLYDIVLEKKRE